MIHISKKDRSLILLILTIFVVIYGLWSGFSYIIFRSTFHKSDINKIFSQDNTEEWLNVNQAVKPEDLRDRIVLLDFWSYSCVNCVEVLQEIKEMEQQFGSKLTVIGIHSGQFENEKNFSEIRKAVIRNDIDYPVINDSKLRIWNEFEIKGLPSFILIDPHGDIYKKFVGETSIVDVKSAIKKLISKYKYDLNRDSLPIVLEKNNIDGNVLSSPTKIEYVADFSYKSRHLPALFIANTSKNSVIATTLSGDVILKIGTNSSGFQDGSFDVASFDSPQGLIYRGGKLYVADTGNHAIREVDFKESKVTTLIGSGQRGDVLSESQIVEAKTFELASPTDIEFFPTNESMVIANSGTHQILQYNITKDTIRVVAGNGSEGLKDGKFPNSVLAQPTDLAVYNRKLYFLDTMSSSLRVIDESGEVKTLIGKDINKFGNKNGTKSEALMQHPMGLTVDDTGVYISDSFNHSIKKYDFASATLSTISGNRKSGSSVGNGVYAEFDQPEGIASVLNNFYIADSNNNRIIILNRANMSTSIMNVMPPLKLPKEGFLQYLPNLKKSPNIAVSDDSELEVEIDLKKGLKINEMGPSFINLLELVKEDKANLVASFDWNDVKNKKMTLPQLDSGKKYLMQGVIYYCENKYNSLCFINSYEQKLEVSSSAKNKNIVIKIGY